ncbi:MAG: hypothetical protein LH480_15125 [Rubrivivax sp.]|nr:hypothetical protein [Rubrivivax sp.]
MFNALAPRSSCARNCCIRRNKRESSAASRAVIGFADSALAVPARLGVRLASQVWPSRSNSGAGSVSTALAGTQGAISASTCAMRGLTAGSLMRLRWPQATTRSRLVMPACSLLVKATSRRVCWRRPIMNSSNSIARSSRDAVPAAAAGGTE